MRSRALHLAVATIAVAALLGASPPSGAQAPSPRSADRFTATPVDVAGSTTGAKTPTSRVAESDPDLLARTDTEPVAVVIKLDYDSISTYAGDQPGLRATSPSVTGRALTDAVATTSPYAREVAAQEADITADIVDAVPATQIGRSFRVVYGGVSAVVPADQARDLLAVPGVVAVQTDTLNQPLTDSSTDFIGAPAVWGAVGGQSTAGEGILFGSLDSGLWPEHPSFAANPDLPAAPRRPDGRALDCSYGDNPLTDVEDVYECNNKLVGGQAYIDTYLLANPNLPEVYPTSARDSNGHGTHTATTSAGGLVDEAPVFGQDRGPVSGVAPGAWVMGYKVCGAVGCYGSDTTSAVEAAILDGVDVINYSISGGTTPFSDPTELAFLDAYAAGVYVSASAGNEGPGAATANHLSSWTTSVAASSQLREFGSDLTLTSGGDTFEAAGVSIGAGVDEDTPVRLSTQVAGYTDARCASAPADPAQFDGLIVGCERGNPAGRVASAYNAYLGGAEGVVLYNPTQADVETDNHWLPVVHLADGTDFVAFMQAHAADEVLGQFTPGIARDGVPDVMAAFSSRGPAGPFLKPDITAPGVQILAGHTPTPESIVEGPPGEYFQAIAGTSMSSPHVAGSGILMLAEHPEWTPGQIRSALMTTATTDVLKEDEETPADPFDMGAGRVDLAAARNPGLTLDETARRFLTLSASPTSSIDLNLPSVNAPVMPGEITTTRTFTNVGGSTATYAVTATAEAGSSITVSPTRFTVAAGASRTVTITIASTNDGGQEFGQIDLTASGREPLHLPVAFVPTPAGATVTSECADGEVATGATTTCTVAVTNDSFGPTTVEATTSVDENLQVAGADGATVTDGVATVGPTELSGKAAGDPSLEPYADGYLPLDMFPSVGFSPIGDEEIIDFGIDPFTYNGLPYDAIGVDSNGYLVVGGSSGSSDNVCCPPQVLPDILPPNNVIAPFWSDLTGDGAPGIAVVLLSDDETGESWTVVEWRVNAFGTTDLKTFQVWLGHGAEQDITMNYPSDARPDLTGLGEDLVIGVENETGEGGESTVNEPPTGDFDVVSTDAVQGNSISYTVDVQGYIPGEGDVQTAVTASGIPGTTVVHTPVTVTGEDLAQVEDFVNRAYIDLLGFPADDASLDYWAGRIAGGTISRRTFALILARDSRWLTPVVDGRYEQFVDRTPGQAERGFWVPQLRNGRSESLLAAQLIGSAEFFDSANREVEAFVDQAYLAVLGRVPEDAGRAYWVDRIDTGLSRSMVGKSFFQVPENRANRSNAQSQLFLGRAPTPAETTAWSEVLRTQTDLSLTATIVGSDAYFALSE